MSGCILLITVIRGFCLCSALTLLWQSFGGNNVWFCDSFAWGLKIGLEGGWGPRMKGLAVGFCDQFLVALSLFSSVDHAHQILGIPTQLIWNLGIGLPGIRSLMWFRGREKLSSSWTWIFNILASAVSCFCCCFLFLVFSVVFAADWTLFATITVMFSSQ